MESTTEEGIQPLSVGYEGCTHGGEVWVSQRGWRGPCPCLLPLAHEAGTSGLLDTCLHFTFRSLK